MCTVEHHPVVKFYPNIKGIILKTVPIISKDYLFHYLLYPTKIQGGRIQKHV